MLATLHDARQDALRQDGATLMDQRLGVERLRPWAVETALARYEVVWLQEEAGDYAMMCYDTLDYAMLCVAILNDAILYYGIL